MHIMKAYTEPSAPPVITSGDLQQRWLTQMCAPGKYPPSAALSYVQPATHQVATLSTTIPRNNYFVGFTVPPRCRRHSARGRCHSLFTVRRGALKKVSSPVRHKWRKLKWIILLRRSNTETFYTSVTYSTSICPGTEPKSSEQRSMKWASRLQTFIAHRMFNIEMTGPQLDRFLRAASFRKFAKGTVKLIACYNGMPIRLLRIQITLRMLGSSTCWALASSQSCLFVAKYKSPFMKMIGPNRSQSSSANPHKFEC